MARGKGKGKSSKLPKGKAPEADTPAPETSASEPVAPPPVDESKLETSAPELPVTPEMQEEDQPQSEPARAAPSEPEALAPEVEKAPEAPTPPPAPRAPLFSTPHPDDEVLDIESASGQMVDGYKESWLAAIRAKSRSMGVGERATRREWRAVFVAWGGPQILK